jgi:AmpE protein
MKLIIVLAALALEHFFGALDRYRDLSWFDRYTLWLERECGGRRLWNGPAGLVLTLAIPLAVLNLLAWALGLYSIVPVLLLAAVVFVYTLGPDLNSRLDSYLESLQKGDENAIADAESLLQVNGVSGADEGERMIRSILIRSHRSIFGVLFWFIALGMTGALLHCLVSRLHERYGDIHGGYADAVRNLHRILMWPSARLQSLGFGLAGNLVDSLEGWQSVDVVSLEASEELLGAAGTGAVRYASGRSAGNGEMEENAMVGWVQEVQALINRTLIVWLTALAIMTLGGWMG